MLRSPAVRELAEDVHLPISYVYGRLCGRIFSGLPAARAEGFQGVRERFGAIRFNTRFC